jgi:hypothetical protein
VTYNGLADTDVVNNNNVAYVSVNLNYGNAQLKYNDLISNAECPLCDGSLTATDGQDCPADGSYDYEVTYTLPALTENEFASWLATGWSGSAVVLVTDSNDGDTIGKCTLTFDSLVTASGANSSIQQAISGKSGVTMVLALLALGMVGCCYCAFCRRNGGKQVDSTKVSHGETEFTRMEDKPAAGVGAAAPTKPSSSSTTAGQGPAWASV